MDIAAQICSLSAYISGLERYPESTSVLSGVSQSRNRSQQSLRIRVGRIGENCFYISALYHAAAVHNGNIIADLCDNTKIMCNKQDGCTCLFFS